ncbi:hypothetical protein DPEC_G00023820 [Dallia pectoralis]|uniref:Uncharacterized protein n=1 Tax=Dallia pectoralis TaxID=75939 RepID=A0ACC2HHQ6_DALPE|nr:hypothetical protein DPEC_G00023820 [Dallia pectoralis]
MKLGRKRQKPIKLGPFHLVLPLSARNAMTAPLVLSHLFHLGQERAWRYQEREVAYVLAPPVPGPQLSLSVSTKGPCGPPEDSTGEMLGHPRNIAGSTGV